MGRPIVDYCLKGYNSTIFAYGQTGSGKTWTIQGPFNTPSQNIGTSQDMRGILPRQFEYMFSEMRKMHTKHRIIKERRQNGGQSADVGKSSPSNELSANNFDLCGE